MARYAVDSGYSARIRGGEFDGMNANEWGAQIFLPTSMPRIVGITVAVVLGLWEFCTFFPAEVVLWQRVSKQRPSRTSFAPWTTLILRYLMLCYSVTIAFIEWSTTMPTDAACKAASGFLFASWCALVVVCSFAIAWRAQAVARGVLQDKITVIAMQMMIAVLVLMQVFMAVFTVVWSAVVELQYTPIAVNGQCTLRSRPSDFFQRKHDFNPRPVRDYVADVFLWYWVVLIGFNLCCLLLVIYALRTLAARSRGFSKFINGMLNHSVFYFVLVTLLSIMGIIWRKVQGASWLIRPTTVIEAAVMIRILLAEQNAARRPVDTTYMDQRHLSNRGYAQNAVDAQPVTYPRGDATVQFVNRNHAMERRSIDRMESEAEAGTEFDPNSRSDHPAVVMRPIYQPYSMMDNLGQAFSQVDSNTHDLDGQSLSSNRQSLNGVPNVYPGVAMMEEAQKRMELEAKLGAGNLEPYTMQENEKGTSFTPSVDISNTNGSSSSEQEKKQNEKESSHNLSSTSSNAAQQTGTKTNRSTLRFLSRNRSHDDIDCVNGDDDDDDDDDELGIQTVSF